MWFCDCSEQPDCHDEIQECTLCGARKPAAIVEPLPAYKLNKGKAMMSLLPFRALLSVAEAMTYGHLKKGYPRHNWRRLSADDLNDALLRHLTAYKSGELLDPESGLPHLAHMCFNALAMLTVVHNLQDK